MEILILNDSDKKCPRQFLMEWLTDVHRELKSWRGEDLCVKFLNPKDIQKLNRQYRGRNKPTDVLSFESFDTSSLGELALCPQVIERNARDHGLHYRQELGYVVLHGVLHLLGYEHEKSPAEARKMFRLQDRIYDKLWEKWWPTKT
jgi:probable rRNA maturation factor